MNARACACTRSRFRSVQQTTHAHEKKQVKKAVDGELKSGKAWRNLEMKSVAELLPEYRFAGPRSAV